MGMHSDKEMKRMKKGHGGKNVRSMYRGGGMKERMNMTHGGAHAANPAPSQPTYGDTVETAMNKAGPN